MTYGKRQNNNKRKIIEFSKLILVLETILVAYVSYKVLVFTEMAILGQYTGSLPYLTTFITAVWTAYGATVSFYQNKSGKENISKIEAQSKLDNKSITAVEVNDDRDC